MHITPSGDIQMVFVSPLRLVHPKFPKWTKISPTKIKNAMRTIEQDGAIRIRDAQTDERALKVFDLPGTSTSPYPIGLIAAADIVISNAADKIIPALRSGPKVTFPFTNSKIIAFVIRIFENGHAAFICVVELKAKKNSNIDQVLYLSNHFAIESPHIVKLKGRVQDVFQDASDNICRAIVDKALPRKYQFDGKIPFVSTFYCMKAEWAWDGDPIKLDHRLWSILQPEPKEDLINQSPRKDEIIIFTSGFHIFVHNNQNTKAREERLVALVSFLILMNILYSELEIIKDNVARLISKRRYSIFSPRDLDEKLEILYSQTMVAAVSWRRDLSSFRDEVDKRWRLSEMKQYCFYLIAALEAGSSRRRAFLLTVLVTFLTITQIVSVVEDGLQLRDRWANPLQWAFP